MAEQAPNENPQNNKYEKLLADFNEYVIRGEVPPGVLRDELIRLGAINFYKKPLRPEGKLNPNDTK